MKADNINVRYLNRAGWGSAFIPGQVFFIISKVSKEVTESKSVTSLYKLWVSNFLHWSEMLQM